ncbi:hypothetical protein HDZ31DRAFT_65301 [Schizophyllum fasciatum]
MDLGSILGARRTRSGAVFSDYVPIAVDVDLDDLYQKAEDAKRDLAEGDCEEGSDFESGTEFEGPEQLASDRGHESCPSTPLTELSSEPPEDPPQAGPAAPGRFMAQAAPLNKSSKARKSARHRRKRRAQTGNDSGSSKRHRAAIIQSAQQVPVEFDLDQAPVTQTAFTALRDASDTGVPALRDLKGFAYVDWDGRQPVVFTAGPEEVIVGILFGAPSDPDWEEDHAAFAMAIEGAASRMTFAPEEAHHRRGDFRVKAHGTSHGGGQKMPQPLKHTKRNKKELDMLVRARTMQRIAHFTGACFGAWQEALHAHYTSIRDRLLDWQPSLRRSLHFKKSPWLCLTINFGPRTLTFPHRDFGNISYGFCSITALGRFNADLGGHIVIKEYKVVVRFPAGSSICIPSAIVTHFNTDIAADETRLSVTQYTSGGIFRFVEHGFQLDKKYYDSLDAEGAASAKADNAARWHRGVAMLSRLPKLAQH